MPILAIEEEEKKNTEYSSRVLTVLNRMQTAVTIVLVSFRDKIVLNLTQK